MSCECLLLAWMVLLALSRLEDRHGRDGFGFFMSAFLAIAYMLWLIWESSYAQSGNFEEDFINFLVFALFGIMVLLCIGGIFFVIFRKMPWR